MAYKQGGWSPYTNDNSGRSKKEEIKHDITELKKEIQKHSDKPHIVKKLKKAIADNKAQLKKPQ